YVEALDLPGQPGYLVLVEDPAPPDGERADGGDHQRRGGAQSRSGWRLDLEIQLEPRLDSRRLRLQTAQAGLDQIEVSIERRPLIDVEVQTGLEVERPDADHPVLTQTHRGIGVTIDRRIEDQAT